MGCHAQRGTNRYVSPQPTTVMWRTTTTPSMRGNPATGQIVLPFNTPNPGNGCGRSTPSHGDALAGGARLRNRDRLAATGGRQDTGPATCVATPSPPAGKFRSQQVSSIAESSTTVDMTRQPVAGYSRA